MKVTTPIPPPLSHHPAQIRAFLTQFTSPEGIKTYKTAISDIARRRTKVLTIKLDDIASVFPSLKPTLSLSFQFLPNSPLLSHILQNTLRYIHLFSSAIDTILSSTPTTTDKNDVLDVIRMHRSQNLSNQPNPIPPELTRRYEIHLVPPSTTPPLPLRSVRAEYVGKMVKVAGIVTRVTEVKPFLTVATYACDKCEFETYQEIRDRTFLPLFSCNSAKCNSAPGGPGALHLQRRGSKFVKFQQIRLQELAHQVSIGHIPRSISVHVSGELTRHCSPGDFLTVSGIFLPSLRRGFHATKAGVVGETYILATHMEQRKQKYSRYILTDEMKEEIEEFGQEGNAYDTLARSIAPELFGMEDVKKALLLQMVGGVTQELEDGMKIRGDINVCLVGDPGVAKSQLLKHIAHLAPRGVYTSGKGSSGVGLTAAVLKDPVTDELVLEGGSLVLADMGICCIDEFDKMDEADRTAIHEVMEQQTISIAKAGITTSLNARTSILAAANPLYGRYNRYKTPAENINLPPALLSRFDLLFVLLDKPDGKRDRDLAEHVSFVHRFQKHPDNGSKTLSPEFIRAYIAMAKRYNPRVPPELTEFIVDAYVSMRNEDPEFGEEYTYTTARSLLGILRLAQALARLRLEEVVERGDVEEAMRMLHASKASLLEDRGNGRRARSSDYLSSIYRIVREYAASCDSVRLPYAELLQRTLQSGYSQAQFDAVLVEYEKLNIWSVGSNKRTITIVAN